jgi:hypothetical protein
MAVGEDALAAPSPRRTLSPFNLLLFPTPRSVPFQAREAKRSAI